MKQFLIKKACPTCHAPITIGLFSNREAIIQCKNCRDLLVENPQRRKIGIYINLAGIIIWLGSYFWPGISLWFGFLIIPLIFLISLIINKLTVIKKDLVIQNKQTKQISYVNRIEWHEILMNSLETENNFEIIEILNF